jgi:nitroreductase
METSKEDFVKTSELEPWNILEEKFPFEGSYHDKLRFFLNYAILAPSSHNTQPWLFKIVDDNNTIELYADRTRALPVVDPDDRELIISCGTALFHLLLTIKHFGFTYKLEIFPKAKEGEEQGDYDYYSSDLLAQVKLLEGKSEPSGEENILFQSITKRRTNRSKFEDREIPDSLISRLQKTASAASELVATMTNSNMLSSSSVMWIHVAKQADEKNTIADLIAEGDRIQMSDRRFRRELASWMHPNRSHSKDGMPGYAFGFSDIMSLLGPFAIRTFDLGKGQAAKDRELATGSPILAIIGTKYEEPFNWLATGVVLSKMLLLARSEDVWCSFLNQPIEVSGLHNMRNKLAESINEEGFPQILMRMGYGQQIKPTPRRTVNEVVH